MISDVFYTRYEHSFFYSDDVPPEFHILFTQIGHIIFEDICEKFEIPISIFSTAHRKLAREIGLGALGPGKSDDDVCGRLLFERYALWNDRHGGTDYFIRIRISLIELIFRELEAFAGQYKESNGKSLFSSSKTINRSELMAAISTAIDEMNARFARSGIDLHYHSGFIQFSDNNLVTKEIEDSFWKLLKEAKWKNVDIDIKEAIDCRDNGRRDAAFYACKALESTIKIISAEKKLTTGQEKGAANYIDNLVSSKNGRIIDVWEADILKTLFSKVRNPHGHGPGEEQMPDLPLYQETMIIENAMSWIKSLIKRS